MGSGPNNTPSGPNTPVAHALSSYQMQYNAYDYNNQAVKVIHHDSTSYSFNLNGDTDSVLALAETNQCIELGKAIPCAGMHQVGIHLVSGGSISIQVNMQDPEGIAPWVTISTISTPGYSIIPICARQVQVIAASGSPVFFMCVQG